MHFGAYVPLIGYPKGIMGSSIDIWLFGMLQCEYNPNIGCVKDYFGSLEKVNHENHLVDLHKYVFW